VGEDVKDLWIIIPASPWGGQTGVLGPFTAQEADERLEALARLPAYMDRCPPKLVRTVRDYAEQARP
jgi:hypothetical protein